jgi:hypothetical protein
MNEWMGLAYAPHCHRLSESVTGRTSYRCDVRCLAVFQPGRVEPDSLCAATSTEQPHTPPAAAHPGRYHGFADVDLGRTHLAGSGAVGRIVSWRSQLHSGRIDHPARQSTHQFSGLDVVCRAAARQLGAFSREVVVLAPGAHCIGRVWVVPVDHCCSGAGMKRGYETFLTIPTQSGLNLIREGRIG